MGKPTKTQLEKDIDKLLNSGNPSWRIIAALSDAYKARGMKPVARRLEKIAIWLHEA